MITTRDREYLRVVFLLKGSKIAVGPLKLSKIMNISKEGAFQEMKRLEKLGFGKYIAQKGLIINKKAIKIVENDIKKHHILENFFQKSLNMTHEQACRESSTIDSFISENLLKNINEKIGPLHQGICGCNLKSPLKPEELLNCHWIKKTTTGG